MTKIRIVLLLSLAALIIIFLITWPDNKVRIIFCDVGQGDGMIISQGSFQMLIDTGPENNKMAGCLGKHLPFWDKTIETVIISHWDKDHSGGLLQIKRNYQMEALYSSSQPVDENEQKYYTGNLALGDVVRYGLVSLEIVNPGEDWGNENDNSVVGLLSYQGTEVLLMGDVTAQVEQKLVWRKILFAGNGLKPFRTILKISHHGSAEATSEELLQAVKPAEAIISVGKNSFGHPTKAVLDRLTKASIKVRRTDEEGDIVIVL